MADHALVAVRGPQIGMLVEKVRDLGLDRPGEQGTGPIAQDFGELIVEESWLNQLDNVIFGHGISLLRWRSGGVKHPHDMPPSRFPPSPTFGDSSSESAKVVLRERLLDDSRRAPMPTECSAEQFDFGLVGRREVVGSFDGGAITSDAGGLLLGKTDRVIGLVDRLAACFTDYRKVELIEHQVATLVGQRVFGIALGYEDLNDHDELRRDPVMAVLAGKLEAGRANCAPVAGKSTLNRLELSRETATRYHKIAADPNAIESLFVTLFLEAYKTPPEEIILDIDATDDPLHGHQEGRFFHGYYDGYCYLPLYVFCGRHLLAAKLRPANIDAAAGTAEQMARIVAQIRGRWPHTRIILRADSGFARDALMGWCEANAVDYIFGLARNARLKDMIAAELGEAQQESQQTGKPDCGATIKMGIPRQSG